MKKPIVFLLLLLSIVSASAQKQDYIWLSGYQSDAGFDTATHRYGGINKFDFNYSPRLIQRDSLGIYFSRTNVCYSDSSGQILFYSNGVEIRNKWDEVIQNSRYMNEGYVLDVGSFPPRSWGYRIPQGLMALEQPLSNQKYQFFQCFFDTLGVDAGITKLLSTYLSISDNNGHGKVLYRDSILIKDTLDWSVTACHHANGRDWWILCKQINIGCYYRILLDGSGLHLNGKTCAGIGVPYTLARGEDYGQSCFSPDGSKYAKVNNLSGISIFDFDRCAGALSNPHNYPLPQLYDSGWVYNGIAFSPNSRYIYASITQYILQFDTWQPDPLSHPDTVGRYDEFIDLIRSDFSLAQLAPDGKIYVASTGADKEYSVIDSPDLPGQACHFMPHILLLESFLPGPPNNPNYRLGKLAGSACDTLSSLMEINSGQLDIIVYPNPSSNFFIVDYGLADWSRHESLELKVTDITGRLVYSTSLSRYSALHKVNSSAFAAGMYLVEILDADGRVLSVRKLVKEE